MSMPSYFIVGNMEFPIYAVHVTVSAMISKFLAGGKLNPISRMCGVFIYKVTGLGEDSIFFFPL